MKILGNIVLAFFAIAIGLYPAMFFFIDMTSQGLLSSKPSALLEHEFYMTSFNAHILFGGLTLLSGWPQFIETFRNRYLRWHRILGYVYVISVLISGLAGLNLSFYANEGLIAKVGFFLLAVSWLFTTAMAFGAIRQGKLVKHQEWMIRSYALAFAAVTLRIYLPLFEGVLHLGFPLSYKLVAWSCWVPNLMVAELIIRRKRAIRNAVSLRL